MNHPQLRSRIFGIWCMVSYWDWSLLGLSHDITWLSYFGVVWKNLPSWSAFLHADAPISSKLMMPCLGGWIPIWISQLIWYSPGYADFSQTPLVYISSTEGSPLFGMKGQSTVNASILGPCVKTGNRPKIRVGGRWLLCKYTWFTQENACVLNCTTPNHFKNSPLPRNGLYGYTSRLPFSSAKWW